MRRRKKRTPRPVLSDHLCECNCGLRTFVAPSSNTKRRTVKGKPYRFRSGHQHRIYQPGKYYFHDRSYAPGKKSAS